MNFIYRNAPPVKYVDEYDLWNRVNSFYYFDEENTKGTPTISIQLSNY